jgi:hypothetical protein
VQIGRLALFFKANGVYNHMYMELKLAKKEVALFRKLNTPSKIQDYINSLGKKPDGKNESIIRSPRLAITTKTASCIEGALLAHAVFKYNKIKSHLVDLRVGKNNNNDVDHVVTIFEVDRHFGAISKTRHAVLRYREPLYKSVRELAISYFHEYFTNDGKKTLRSYSAPFDVVKKFGTGWITSNEDLYEIASELDDSPHTTILTKKMERSLRLADKIEIIAGKLTE